MSIEPDLTGPQTVVNGRRAGSGRLAGLVHGAAALTTGLIAGLFFDWTVSIMPALSEADDKTFIVVMQNTTTTMANSPLFLATFMGAMALTGSAAVLQHRLRARASVRWILAALALYAVAFLITMAVHMPLNESVVAAGDVNDISDMAALRHDVEGLWVNTHVIRTLTTTAALGCLCRALWLRREGEPPTGVSS